MGFRLEKAKGRSVAVKATKRHGAPATVNLEALLESPPAGRAKWIRDHTDRKITANVSKGVRGAITIEALRAALGPVVDNDATPDLVSPGSMVLQPSEERRRSGSHYTPRELTEPIVRDTLKPVLDRLRDDAGGPPTPDQLLDLKVCDPAMGSGAFLVEACRQMGAALVESWHHHEAMPDDAKGEDELVLARREVARRCLYGVDRNPVAVDLAKLSLWMVTLSKDLPLTFLDHALRHGDSLVGLTNQQIASFHWKANAPTFQLGFEAMKAQEQLARAKELRRQIREAGEDSSDRQLRDMLDEADSAVATVRQTGDLVMVAFFDGAKPKQREEVRARLAHVVADGTSGEYGSDLEARRSGDPPLAPFHWQVEFPEVFDRDNPGFDGIVGNPPFLGGKRISTLNGPPYRDWLASLHSQSTSNADLVAHFFRRSFSILRHHGTLGLIATNTIAQGDTRESGLRWICKHKGQIYKAIKRVEWPASASVVVSIIHIVKDANYCKPRYLNGQETQSITAFLFHAGGHDSPARLHANADKGFVGVFVRGIMGFSFDDEKPAATPLSEMHKLIERDSKNSTIIRPYIGGREVNSSPTHAADRYVIDFRDLPLRRTLENNPNDRQDPVAADWPELLSIVRTKVKPFREGLHPSIANRPHIRHWWQFANGRPKLRARIKGLSRVLVKSDVGQHFAFAFVDNGMVYSHSLVVFSLDQWAAFCVLQSRIHECWASFFGSSLGDGKRYPPSDVFETFPFPRAWEAHPSLEAAGKEYYQFRADLMARNDEGLTKTYNRFHDPNEKDLEIDRLRDLHTAMDRAVFEAYGWTDILTDCDFLLDYKIDEEEWGRKKKPYRYRWSDNVHDRVLARLLELNGQRAAEEPGTREAELNKATPLLLQPRQ